MTKYKVILLPEGRYLNIGETKHHPIHHEIATINDIIHDITSLPKKERNHHSTYLLSKYTNTVNTLTAKLIVDAEFMSKKKAEQAVQYYLEHYNKKNYNAIELEYIPIKNKGR